MNLQSLRSTTVESRTDKAMTSEQFTQVIEAILSGKYSWACLLILRFAGYNPLHYIPYRTFNRLVKENMPSRKKGPAQPKSSGKNHPVTPNQAQTAAQQALDKIPDLAYLDSLDEEMAQMRGGCRLPTWLSDHFPPYRRPTSMLKRSTW
jgi:hypothetical protein